MKNLLHINPSHFAVIDNNADVSKLELAFVHTVIGSFNTFWAYRVYNNICPCCGVYGQQIAVEITKENVN